MRRGVIVFSHVVVLGVGSVGCAMPKRPGELVGAYHISGELTDNSCGSSALPAANRLSFDVEIRQDHGAGLWVRDMPPPHSGRLNDDGSFAFEFTTSYTVNTMPNEALATGDVDPAKLADPTLVEMQDRQAMQGCRLSVDESVNGMLHRDPRSSADAGAVSKASSSTTGDPDLVADNEIAIQTVAGSSCEMVLAAQGGPFKSLPCSAHYDLKGELANP
jgi:hypothetical protein